MADLEHEVLARIERQRHLKARWRDERITMAHGAGMKATQTLVDGLFEPSFSNDTLAEMSDAAKLEVDGAALAFSTDAYVVNPLIFPGSSIGELAVNGTVNDLAVSGARPIALSAAFVLEEGLDAEVLRREVEAMATAAGNAGVQIVTGDTKVVERGKADGMYIVTTGIGVRDPRVSSRGDSIRAGDSILCSGTIGDHGTAVMLARGELELDADVSSDSAPVWDLVSALIEAVGSSVRVMRDPTRGGVATVLNELAEDADVGVVLDEASVPVQTAVKGACEILGIDPMYVANEGKVVAVVAPDAASDALAALQSREGGERAAVIGEVAAEPAGMVLVKTGFGGTRIMDMLIGDPLPAYLLMEQTDDLRAEFVRGQYRTRSEIVGSFFSTESGRMARLCHLMAQRFACGGRLIAFGAGAAATDAQHVSVEFVHPVIVGKRALPALALPNDVSILGAAVTDPSGFFARRLEVVGAQEDIALGLVHGPDDPGREAVAGALKQAAAQGMLTLWLGVPEVPEDGGAEHRFAVPADDTFVVQEIQETLYHVLWELVHVFFEHKGLLVGRSPGTTHDSGRSSFLYPFLAATESDAAGVLAEVEASILQKAGDVGKMREDSMDAEGLVETALLMSQRIRTGGKVLVFGNGGSATDAQDFVADLIEPPESMEPVNALSLTNEEAVITAVANDVGFENVFARQIIAYGNDTDIAFAISTSGGSRNVVAAMEEAKRRGMLTVALAGYEGGRLKEICDRSHTITAEYVPRIQEAQATQYHVIRRLLGST